MISWWSGVISGIFFRRNMEDSRASEAGRCNKIGHMLIIAQLGDGGWMWGDSFYYPLELHIYSKTSIRLSQFFFFFWPHCAACGNILLYQEPNLSPWQWKPEILTTGPPGNSLLFFFFLIFVEWMIQEGIFLLNTRLIFSKNNTFLKMDSFPLGCSRLTAVEHGMFRD